MNPYQFYGPEKELMLMTSFDMDRVVVFLPGINGGAHSGRFLSVDQLAKEEGYAAARIALWEGEESLTHQSYTTLFAQLDGLFAELEKLGFIDALLVGKSFGGGVALMYQYPLISRKVLWAPAIGVASGGEAGNWDEVSGKKFATLPDLLTVRPGHSVLAQQTLPVGIIHGTADDVIPFSNSKALVAALPNAALHTINAAGHSFKDHEHEVELLALTKQLLG